MGSVKKLIKSIGIGISKKSPAFRVFAKHTINRLRKNRYLKSMGSIPVDENSVVFESFGGERYVCSPKAIFKCMVSSERFNDMTFTWILKGRSEDEIDALRKEYPELRRAEIITGYRDEAYNRAYFSAKYFITNARLPEYIEMRPGQKYVQCWHGTPLKRLGYDIPTDAENSMNSHAEILEKYDLDAPRYSYMVSPSAFCSEKYVSAFALKKNNPNVEIIEEGYPRNDSIFETDPGTLKNIKEKLRIKEGDERRIILYAPTFRDNQHTTGLGYTYDLNVDFDKWQEELGEKYIILFRAHYFIANSFNLEKYKGFVFDVSEVEDINDLYRVADILLTDYSSVLFDYAILKRPMMFYMYDLDDYQNKIRDFYIDLDELPGEIFTDEEALLKAVKEYDFSYDCYDEKYRAFHEKYNGLEDGHATERVVERIFGKR